MTRKRTAGSARAALLVLAASGLGAVVSGPIARAAWLLDGTPLVQLPTSQESPSIASDGSGGAIVVWRDSRNGATSDIYAQRIDAAGLPVWTPNGVVVSAATGTQSSPDVFPDGSGGAVVAWRDDRNGSGDVYAQRISAQGLPLWNPAGVALAASPSNETFPTIIADQSTGVVTPVGFILSYFDRPIGQPAILRVQHIDLNGVGLWATAVSGGVIVTASTGQKFDSAIASDGVGPVNVAKGAVLVWDEMDNSITGQDIYANRVSAAGVPQWGPEGIIVCGLPGLQIHPTVASLASSTVVVVWEDSRNVGLDLYAQKLNSSGGALWLDQGVPVVTETGSDSSPKILGQGVGGALIFWLRGGRVYGQHLDTDGNTRWDGAGVPLASMGVASTLSDVVSDGVGGAIVAWIDTRNGNSDLFAQRIDGAGALLWDQAGVPLCVATSEQAIAGLATDGDQGAIAAWRDDRDGNLDVYANRAFGTSVVSAPGLSHAKDGPQLAVLSANPASDQVRLLVDLPGADQIALDVFDLRGRRVRRLSPGSALAPGTHRFAWDRRDEMGTSVAAGTYVIRMTTATAQRTARVVVIR